MKPGREHVIMHYMVSFKYGSWLPVLANMDYPNARGKWLNAKVCGHETAILANNYISKTGKVLTVILAPWLINT